jgi:hypothetical protein
MRLSKLSLGILFALIWESQCFGYGSIACVSDDPTRNRCYSSNLITRLEAADLNALNYCQENNVGKTCSVIARTDGDCTSIISPYPDASTHYVGHGSSPQLAAADGQAQCQRLFRNCGVKIVTCDKLPEPQSSTVPQLTAPAISPKERLAASGQQAQTQSKPAPPQTSEGAKTPEEAGRYDFSFLKLAKLYENIISGIGLGLGILIVILIYAKRAAIANFVIHGNLPYTIENRSDDIEVLFKRSQRLNWTGRVIFGLTAQLGMTEQQLLLIRRYRLGRVVAFDSLRRQKQNELAQLHLQLASEVETKAKDDKPLSQLLASLWAVFLIFFWFIRALFSFLFGFLFLRVTIAKLVRGQLIESIELKLLMETKIAIEQTAIYLKEYLLLAETFDGREEVYEPPA